MWPRMRCTSFFTRLDTWPSPAPAGDLPEITFCTLWCRSSNVRLGHMPKVPQVTSLSPAASPGHSFQSSPSIFKVGTQAKLTLQKPALSTTPA